MRVSIISILLMLFLIFQVSAQDEKLIEENKQLILRTLYLKEFNPIHKAESDSINKLLIVLVKDYSNDKLTSSYNNDLINFNKLIFENGIWEFEDSPEIRRFSTRQSICFACIALKVVYEKSLTYIELAKFSLIGNVQGFDFDLLESEFLGIELLTILIKYENNDLRIYDLDQILKFIDKNRLKLEPEVVNDTQKLIDSYQKILD